MRLPDLEKQLALPDDFERPLVTSEKGRWNGWLYILVVVGAMFTFFAGNISSIMSTNNKGLFFLVIGGGVLGAVLPTLVVIANDVRSLKEKSEAQRERSGLLAERNQMRKESSYLREEVAKFRRKLGSSHKWRKSILERTKLDLAEKSKVISIVSTLARYDRDLLGMVLLETGGLASALDKLCQRIEDQIEVSLKLIHAEILKDKTFNGKFLRVVLFGKAKGPEPSYLDVLYSHDGLTGKTVTVLPTNFPLKNNKLWLVDYYQNGIDHCAKAMSDCHNTPGFVEVETQTPEKCQSLFCYKHRREKIPDSLILCVDCDVVNFFTDDSIKAWDDLLDVIMYHLDYRLMLLKTAQFLFALAK